MIDEAIKLQGELLSLLPEVGFNKYIASTRLSLEALERIKEGREKGYDFFGHLLPGEQEEIKNG